MSLLIFFYEEYQYMGAISKGEKEDGGSYLCIWQLVLWIFEVLVLFISLIYIELQSFHFHVGQNPKRTKISAKIENTSLAKILIPIWEKWSELKEQFLKVRINFKEFVSSKENSLFLNFIYYASNRVEC